jgi:hypothetical protein
LAVTLLLEGRVLTTSLKEVDERFIEVTQGLLRRDTRDLIQPGVFILLLEVGPHRGEVFVVEAASFFVVRVRFVAQAPIVNDTDTAKGTSKIDFLLVGWVAPEFVGSSLCTHTSHFTTQRVKSQQHQERSGFVSSPCLKAGVSAKPNFRE